MRPRPSAYELLRLAFDGSLRFLRGLARSLLGSRLVGFLLVGFLLRGRFRGEASLEQVTGLGDLVESFPRILLTGFGHVQIYQRSL